MTERPSIPDASVREQAVTTFDQNVVVIAGAGTGKTTLLVNRLVHLLMREPGSLELARIVALTFTNKAASEMKVRLRGRLTALLSPERPEGSPEAGAVQPQDLRDRYGLTFDRIAAKAEAALRQLEQAQIGTVHSFAAHLLRLYPLEGGVAPDFREDDGLRLDELFQAQWDLWIDRELGPGGDAHARWRRVLRAADLPELRDLARALCNDHVRLDDLTTQLRSPTLSGPLLAWLTRKRGRAAELLATSGQGKSRKVESLLEAAGRVYAHALESPALDLDEGARTALAERLAGNLGAPPAGWTPDAFAEARDLIAVARRLLMVPGPLVAEIADLLLPLVRTVRAGFLEEGWVSFDGLLAKARDLLSAHPSIRDQLKQDYQAVLVDEFQDTDPMQYEIILFLAERAGRRAAAWHEVDLEPGKLFIVGDPKQSIYTFRRADIEAFQRVVSMIGESGGRCYELRTNFRSHRDVLDVVNAVFDRLFAPDPGECPSPSPITNVPLEAVPERPPALQRPGVELRVVQPVEDDFDAAAATRAEAAALAAWISDELLANERLRDRDGLQPLRPGHVALLFRTLTQAQTYLDALRRVGIPYVTDGEKHFYRRQEVIDLVNVLRVLLDPHDAVALVGVLRSPLGAVADRALVALRERGALDYRQMSRLSGWDDPHAGRLAELYGRLAELHGSMPHRALPAALDLLFSRLPVLELAAASQHGEQAVANLLKVRELAVDLADRAELTMRGFVELMMARVAEQPDESESALAEESLDAVRVLTIHKAKGLEFPVVVLPGLHGGTSATLRFPLVSSDWTTGLAGFALRDCWSLGGVAVHEKVTARQDAEQRRILYVGMTRARDRLVLSGGLIRHPVRESFWGLLKTACAGDLGEAGVLKIGQAAIRRELIPARDQWPEAARHQPGPLGPAQGVDEQLRRWAHREQTWKRICRTPWHLTPTAVMDTESGRPSGPQQGRDGSSLLIGTLAHRILEEWDFHRDPADLPACVTAACRYGIPDERQADSARIEAELQSMMRVFAGSAAYRDLQRATILGREIPFVIPWPQPLTPDASPLTPACVMEGRIDLVYCLDGAVWVMDYKTDRVPTGGLAAQALRYGTQASIYRAAVARCLHLDAVRVQFMFLRTGEALAVE